MEGKLGIDESLSRPPSAFQSHAVLHTPYFHYYFPQPHSHLISEEQKDGDFSLMLCFYRISRKPKAYVQAKPLS